MSRPRSFRSLRRKTQTRTPKQKIVIYAEGEKTESDYFLALKRRFAGVLVDVEIMAGAGVPLTIATKATAAARSARKDNRQQSFSKNDQYWAVFDRDEHPHIAEAMQICRSGAVSVAFSDPCFELWLILHFADFDRPDHRHDVQRHLEGLCPDYDRKRGKTTNCDSLIDLLPDAEKRAEKQLARRKDEGDPPGAPHTTVYLLTQSIRAASESVA